MTTERGTGQRLRVAVLVSGRGSNLQALIDASASPDYPAEIVLVISNRPGAFGLERARRAGIEALTIDHKAFAERPAFEHAVTEALQRHGVEMVCLAGFLRVLTDGFVNQWHDRLINIHPSLLPAFKGLHVHQRVLDAGVRFTGCTVHFVRPAMDAGPIIVQAVVPVLGDDTADVLGERVLAAEHQAFPLALRLVAEGRARVVGERVEINGHNVSKGLFLNPNRC